MKNPILLFTALFALGIVFADNCSYQAPRVILLVATLALLSAILILVLAPKKKILRNWLFIFFAGLAILLLGFERYQLSIPTSIPVEGYCLSIVKIKTYPERTKNSWRTTAQLERVKKGDSWQEVPHGQGPVMLYFSPDSQLPHKGDRLMVWSKWKTPLPPRDPSDFDYQKYLLHKGINLTSTIYNNQYRLLEPSRNKIVLFHNHIQQIIQSSSLSDQQKGIEESLILGYRSHVDQETQHLFRSAGITHLLCVSGLHVGIVAAILSALLWFLPLGRYYRLTKGLLTILGVWLFALFTGMSPSTIRASMMLTFLICGRLLNSGTHPLNSLAASALLLLLVRPGMLFDIGFQLSYAAVFGILLFYKPLNQLIPFPSQGLHWKTVKKLWDLIVLSTCAQLACTPFLLYYFHQFAPYFLLANITIIPLAGILLGSGILMIALHGWTWGFSAMTWVVSAQLNCVHFITDRISQLPHSLVEEIPFSRASLVISLMLLALLGFIVNRKKEHV